MVGRTVLHYQLLEKLGAGGMGEIFKAQDTRLNRYVAVKVLSATGGGGDMERRRRFTQEAQAASALNHPNIITIHDIISDGDTDYMVMEYVAGKTLVDLIPKGGLRAPQVLKYTVQMADALNAAHTAGIIHRDLKPGNVMVTDSGLVKILDFGLAKLADRGPLSQMGEDTDDKTRTIANAPLTVEGSIIGTVSYMSPEQAQGKKVDTRSDIFSFGVVMYEMATGVRAFPGDSALSTLSAILRDEVKPLVEAAPEAPPQLDLVIQRCLRKNPDERWQTMKDVQMALAALKHESDSGMLYRARMADIPSRAPATVVTKPVNAPATLPPPDVAHIQVKSPDEKKSSPGLMIGAVAAAVVLLGAGGAAWWYKHRPVPPPPAPVVETPAPAPPVAVVTPPPAEPAPPPENILTNDSVIEMVKSKVPDSVVLSQIRSEKTNFTLTTPEIIRLSNAGVPPIIIEGMRDPKKIPEQPVVSKPPVVTPTTPPKQVATAPKQTPAVVPASTPPPPVPQPVATPTPAPAPPVVTPVAAPPVHPATATVVVPDATPFPVLLSADIMKGMDAGTPLRFTAEQDFKIGDNVVIAKGTVVTGSIVDTGGNRILGMGAKMSLRIDQTESTAAQKIALRALGARKPDGVTTRPAEVKGNSSKAKDVVATAGSEYYAYIDGEQKVTVKK